MTIEDVCLLIGVVLGLPGLVVVLNLLHRRGWLPDKPKSAGW